MTRLGYLVLLPLVGTLSFVGIYPLVFSFYLSLTGQNGSFVGLANYLEMVKDDAFWNSLSVSLAYSLGSTALALAIGLFFIFLLTQKFRGTGVFETLLVVPLAIPPIVAGILWSPSAVWDDINSFAHFVLGLPYIDLLSPLIYFPVMILSEAWEWAPLLMLVGLSVVTSIRKEVFEAASVHGASSWQIFRLMVVPAVLGSPVMQFVLVLRFIDAMRAFEIPFAWSTWVGYPQSVGSPVDTLSLYLYKLMFTPRYDFPVPYISAIAISLFLVSLLAAGTLLRFMNVVRRLT